MKDSKYIIETVKVRLKRPVCTNPTIREPQAVYNLAKEIYGELDADQEHFVIFALNKANEVSGFKCVHTGGIDQTMVCPGTVFRYALLMGASAIVALHNHPSGRIEPSAEDRQITKKLVDAGAMLNIRVLDHIIVTETDYFSFREHGLIG